MPTAVNQEQVIILSGILKVVHKHEDFLLLNYLVRLYQSSKGFKAAFRKLVLPSLLSRVNLNLGLPSPEDERRNDFRNVVV
jgi:hypothetical protein